MPVNWQAERQGLIKGHSHTHTRFINKCPQLTQRTVRAEDRINNTLHMWHTYTMWLKGTSHISLKKNKTSQLHSSRGLSLDLNFTLFQHYSDKQTIRSDAPPQAVLTHSAAAPAPRRRNLTLFTDAVVSITESHNYAENILQILHPLFRKFHDVHVNK